VDDLGRPRRRHAAVGVVAEATSRYGDKPALVMSGREIAHVDHEAIDVRITAAGWRALPQTIQTDPAVLRDSRRRDWIEIVPAGEAVIARLDDLVQAVHRHNLA
jgi:hypothetical protein